MKMPAPLPIPMKRLLERFAALAALLLLLVSFPCASSAREGNITILFTNDHDGQVESLSSTDGSKPVGGVSRRMSLIEQIKKEVGPDHVVLVDAGGLFPGTPFSEMTQGEVDCAAYQLMNYDAIAIGEHDFEYGQKTLEAYRRKFKIPWVSANLVRGGQPFFRPYALKWVGGIRVGLIGFSNPATPELMGREKLRGLVFNPPGAAAKGLHSIFKKDADLFIVLSRLGVEGDKKLAKDNGFLHVIIGGYSKTLLHEAIEPKTKDGRFLGPLIVQAGSRGLYLGRLDLSVEGRRDRKTKNAVYFITHYQYRLIPVTSDLPEDPQMVELLQKYKATMQSKPLSEVLATVTGDFTNPQAGDSLVGELTADLMRDAAGTEVALLNNGFFVQGFQSGPLTREKFYEVCPSNSGIVAMDVRGHDLRKALEGCSKEVGKENFLQVSGLTIQTEEGKLKIMVGKEPLNDRRKYLVAVNDFLGSGGGGFDLFRNIKSRRKIEANIRDLLEEKLKQKQKIGPEDLEKRWILP